MVLKIKENKIWIKQKAEMLEIFTGFETKNRYRVHDENDKDIFYAYEESNFLSRILLGKHRKLTLQIIDENKKVLLSIFKPFHWFSANFEVKDSLGNVVATFRQKKFFINTKFDVYGTGEIFLFSCEMKFPKIWTFNIVSSGQNIALISKKWGGGLKEGFSDADNFLIDFKSIKPELKYLVLAMGLAIDIRKFEKKIDYS